MLKATVPLESVETAKLYFEQYGLKERYSVEIDQENQEASFSFHLEPQQAQPHSTATSLDLLTEVIGELENQNIEITLIDEINT